MVPSRQFLRIIARRDGLRETSLRVALPIFPLGLFSFPAR